MVKHGYDSRPWIRRDAEEIDVHRCRHFLRRLFTLCHAIRKNRFEFLRSHFGEEGSGTVGKGRLGRRLSLHHPLFRILFEWVADNSDIRAYACRDYAQILRNANSSRSSSIKRASSSFRSELEWLLSVTMSTASRDFTIWVVYTWDGRSVLYRGGNFHRT